MKRTERMNARLAVAPMLLAAFVSARAQAPAPFNVEACEACHGPAGVSLNPTIPNLAGQKPAYLESQLKAFHSKERKNDLMNANAAAWEAARVGQKLPNGSVILQVTYQVQQDPAGKEIPGAVQSYAGMELRNNWGKEETDNYIFTMQRLREASTGRT